MSDAWAVLGEDRSDAETLKALIKKIKNNDRMTVKIRGYDGCGELLRKGANQLGLFAGLGCTKFVVCHDADRNDPRVVYQKVLSRIVSPSGLGPSACIVVPVQEIEAWILADVRAVTHIIPSWLPDDEPNPEAINNPKERLLKLSEGANHRPRYTHAVHNPVVAKHLNPQVILSKCRSFQPFYDFVTA